MAAGTLSVTNNSKAVVGVGTTFTAFNAGDFLTLVVGQVPYTVAIASVESDTAITLVLPFDGPTATGLAWDGVKRDTMSLATMGVTVQAQKALRLMIADENNWRAIFGDEEEVTVTLPNGQVMQGLSWGYLSQLMKQIDPVEMRNLQQQAAASEAAAQGFRNEAEGFKTETAGIRDATNQIKADTQAIHDATNTIKTQTDQIKSDTQAIKDQTNQIKTDTGLIRDEANTAKTDAQGARDAALGYRNEAEQFKNEIDPSQFLAKGNNLSDVTDHTAARDNLGIGPTDTLNLGGLVTSGLVSAGRNTWDGSNWGSKWISAALAVLSPDGESTPGLYVRRTNGADGYASFWIYAESNNTWSTPSLISGSNFKGVTLYGAWDDSANAGVPLMWGSVAPNNDGGFTPALSWGTSSSGGYPIRATLGLISQGTGAWPLCALRLRGDGEMATTFQFHPASGDITTWGVVGNFSFQKLATSDRDLKHDIKYTEGKESYDRVMQWLPTMFKYNGSEIQRYGLIAQDLVKVDPQYVKIIPGALKDPDQVGTEGFNADDGDYYDDTLALDSNVILTDMACAMVFMGRKMEDMRKELDELKAAIAALTKA